MIEFILGFVFGGTLGFLVGVAVGNDAHDKTVIQLNKALSQNQDLRIKLKEFKK